MNLTPRQSEIVKFLSEEPRKTTEMAEKFDISPSAARDHVYRLREKGVNIDYDDATNTYYLDQRFEGDELKDKIEPAEIAAKLEDGITFSEFTDEYDANKSVLKRIIKELRTQGYTIDHKIVDEKGTKLFFIPSEEDKFYKAGSGDGSYTFALMGDTHLGSSSEHLEELHDFYDRLVERGVERVFHAGDISDGWKVHKGHINEIKGEASGWERLQEYVVENYPQRDGIDTFFISGNHDNKLHRRTGVRFGELIARERDDLHYCGDSMARFVFDEENDIDLELIHPSGGKPYTPGYRIMTLYRERPVTNRPTIAGVGHLHGSMYVETEGVMGFYVGGWKGLTTYGKRKGHNSVIGGWIIDMEIEDGEVRNMVPNWIGYESEDRTDNFTLDDIEDFVSE